MRVRALVMKNLQCECFGGTTFHVDNDIETRIKAGTVGIHGKFTVSQSNSAWLVNHDCQPPPDIADSNGTSRAAIKAHVKSSAANGNGQEQEMKLRAVSLSTDSVTFPGDYLSIPLTSQTAALNYISITPSFPKAYDDEQWKPQVCEIIDNTALFRNNSHVSMLAAKHSHFKPNHVSICALHEVGSYESSSPDSFSNSKYRAKPSPYKSIPEDISDLLKPIVINTNVMTKNQLSCLEDIHSRNHQVFNGDLTGGYNHQSGRFFAVTF